MRKYFRLVLVIVSVVSVVTLLFYRHEYNRLRYVLEVLNFFGKPGEVTINSDCFTNNTILDAGNASFADPLPVWHRLSNDLFIYSAFWEVIGRTEHVKAITVRRNTTSLKVGCRLWYENQEFSSEGRVSYAVMPMKITQASSDREKVFPYFITCAPEVTLEAAPYAVEFYLDGHNSNEVVVPVSVPDPSQDMANNTVMCVTPSNRKISASEMVEFIGFHQVLGVTQYLVYDDGLLTPTALELLKERNLGYRAAILPWNFPFMSPAAADTTLKWDCLLRSAGAKAGGVLQLAWHQLAVPRYHHSLAAMTFDFDKHLTTARFLLPGLRFCLEYPEQRTNAVLRALRRSYHADTMPSQEQEWALERPHLVSQGGRTQQRISRGIVAIHSYQLCQDVSSAQPAPAKKYDNSFARFTSELQESKLLRLWSRHQI